MPRDLHSTQGSAERVSIQLRLSDEGVAHVVGIARLVAYGHFSINIMFDLDSAYVVVSSQVVSVLEAVVIRVGNGRGAIEQPGYAVIRNVVCILMEVTERHA